MTWRLQYLLTGAIASGLQSCSDSTSLLGHLFDHCWTIVSFVQKSKLNFGAKGQEEEEENDDDDDDDDDDDVHCNCSFYQIEILFEQIFVDEDVASKRYKFYFL